MKVYIASSFSLIDKVEEAARKIEAAGFEITVKWWARKYEVEGEGQVATTDLKKRFMGLTEDEFYAKPECKFSFDADKKGVLDADLFLFVADEKHRAYNGANIELGIAIGAGKPCFSIGRLMNSVLYFPVNRCKSVEEFIFLNKVVEGDGIIRDCGAVGHGCEECYIMCDFNPATIAEEDEKFIQEWERNNPYGWDQ